MLLSAHDRAIERDLITRSEAAVLEVRRARAIAERRAGNARMIRALRDRKASLDAMRNPEACVTCGTIFDQQLPFDWYCERCEGKRR